MTEKGQDGGYVFVALTADVSEALRQKLIATEAFVSPLGCQVLPRLGSVCEHGWHLLRCIGVPPQLQLFDGSHKILLATRFPLGTCCWRKTTIWTLVCQGRLRASSLEPTAGGIILAR